MPSPDERAAQELIQKRQQEAATLILRQLTQRLVGQVAPEVQSEIQQLRVEQLEELGEALLDFSSMQDLTDWLQNYQG